MGAKKAFSSKAVVIAKERMRDEEAAMFGGGVSAAGHKRRAETVHRVTFECGDDLYYAMFLYVKRRDSPYKSVSELCRKTVAEKIGADGEASVL